MRVTIEFESTSGFPSALIPLRSSLSFAIPEAQSTSVELEFSDRESEIIIGTNENFGQRVLEDGRGTRPLPIFPRAPGWM